MKFNANKRLGAKVKISAFSKTVPSSVVRLYDESFVANSGKLWNTYSLKKWLRQRSLMGFKVFLGKFLKSSIQMNSQPYYYIKYLVTGYI